MGSSPIVRKISRSSMVELSAHNGNVVGSIPSESIYCRYYYAPLELLQTHVADAVFLFLYKFRQVG